MSININDLILSADKIQYTGFGGVITDNLLVYLDAGYKQSYPGSGNTWYDLSGNVNNAKFDTTPPYVDGSSGFFVMNGIPEYSNTTPSITQYPYLNIDLRRDFSIEMWIMPHAPNRFFLFGQGTGTINQGMYAILEPDYNNLYVSESDGTGTDKVQFHFNSTSYTTFDSVNIPRYTWNHFVFTYNHSSPYTRGLYVNGVSQTPVDNGLGQYAGTGNLRFGLQNSAGSTFWRSALGRFAQIRIYSKILSQSEVTLNYNATKKRYTYMDDGRVTTPSGIGSISCEYLVIAGGGGGGAHYAGGGGAGGYREGTLNINTGINYTVTVGGGGSAGLNSSAGRRGGSGSNSVFNTVTSAGGGGGGGRSDTSYNFPALSGGSGGGGGNNRSGPYEGGGNFPFTNPPQGNNGGFGFASSTPSAGGGGGGAGFKGVNANSCDPGEGGNGRSSTITGTSVTRGGGGGAAGASGVTSSSGGTGGGGNGGAPGAAGTANTGGGGGGGRASNNGGAGGSGIVIIKYPDTYTISVGAGLTSSTSTSGGFSVTSFTAGTGTVSFT